MEPQRRAMAAALPWSLLCLALVSLAASLQEDGESFPVYLGSHAQGGHLNAQPLQVFRTVGIDMSKVKQLSSSNPRAYLYEGFLSEAECDHIRAKATPKLRRSFVANNKDGSGEVSEVRTSSGTFIGKGTDQVMRDIEQRISEWTLLPIPNQEPLQVLRYTKGQKYEPHFDYFSDPVNKQRGGHRYATVLMYLNTPELGGETVFPTAKDPTPKDDTWSDCTKGKLAVKAKKGDAVLFFSMHPDGTPDPTSLHHACPVVKGEKWSAPMWIHVADFNKMYKQREDGRHVVASDGDGCSDTNGMCKFWAQRGECEKNAIYMLRACKFSCNSCK